MNNIPNFKPYLAPNAKKYVNECLTTGWIGTGKYLGEVEKKVKKLFGVEYVILVNNGTNACKLALLGCGIGTGDKVLSPVFTYIASNNSIISVGAEPVFLDIEDRTWNINTEEIKVHLTERDDIKAIMAVNLLGRPVDYTTFLSLANSCRVKVIEDNCQSIFAKYNGKYAGTIGDAAAFSFFSNKIIACGEGGMVFFKREEDYKRALLYKNQGRDYTKGRYYHDSYGENLNLTNLQAAIILAQLEDYDYILKKRDKIDDWYREYLYNIEHIKFRDAIKVAENVTWYVAVLAYNRDDLVKYMEKNGVSLNPVWKLNNLMPHLQQYSMLQYRNANYVADYGVMLPTYVDMTKEEVKHVCELIRLFYATN
jgi:perosamine synthetase